MVKKQRRYSFYKAHSPLIHDYHQILVIWRNPISFWGLIYFANEYVIVLQQGVVVHKQTNHTNDYIHSYSPSYDISCLENDIVIFYTKSWIVGTNDMTFCCFGTISSSLVKRRVIKFHKTRHRRVSFYDPLFFSIISFLGYTLSLVVIKIFYTLKLKMINLFLHSLCFALNHLPRAGFRFLQ